MVFKGFGGGIFMLVSILGFERVNFFVVVDIGGGSCLFSKLVYCIGLLRGERV